ncbi:hypothetical protein ACFX5U_09745 [Sphingobacterium sp. SG20118]|uniref:hypothetical protein n=1 Tax=unclassified Sphingobacterium TaxID=2609468 RepID=UPI000A5F689F|nr:hypothetical protein [Sphingobacterium sp. ML3W]
MDNNLDNKTNSSEEEVPEAAHDEKGDKPAAKTIPWAIWIAVIVMIIVFLYMWQR